MTTVDLVTTNQNPGVLELRLNRPRSANALNTALLQQLAEALETAAQESSVRAVVITGGSVLFSIGADLKEFSAALATDDGALDNRSHLYECIARCPKPVIAAVCGPAIGGGCELALAADIVVAGKSARFAFPETDLGIIPGGGGTQRLIRVVGKSLAMHMILAGRELSADEARASGLLSEVVEDSECLPQARAIAQAIAARPPQAVLLAKESVLQAFETNLQDGLAIEHRHFIRLIDTLRRNS